MPGTVPDSPTQHTPLNQCPYARGPDEPAKARQAGRVPLVLRLGLPLALLGLGIAVCTGLLRLAALPVPPPPKWPVSETGPEQHTMSPAAPLDRLGSEARQ